MGPESRHPCQRHVRCDVLRREVLVHHDWFGQLGCGGRCWRLGSRRTQTQGLTMQLREQGTNWAPHKTYTTSVHDRQPLTCKWVVVVIIYSNIFLPLLLTALSVNFVLLLTLCDCSPHSSFYLSIIPFSRSRVQPCDCPPLFHP